ncbi:MAG: hypothetical protein ACOY30_13930 [Bacillota bacterium]
MRVEFKKEIVKTSFHSPKAGFQLTPVNCEIRYDPLTNQLSRIFPSKKMNFPEQRWKSLADESKSACPFCPENIEKATPRFPEDLIPTGRLKAGKACVIPNLSVYESYSGVVIMSPDHYVEMEEISADMIFQSLCASLEFLVTVHRKDPGKSRYGSVNWNYMPCAGGSMIHPHLQVIAGKNPSTYVQTIVEAGNFYYNTNRSIFWSDLIETEAGGERHPGNTGDVVWLTTFAPRGLADITAVIPGKRAPWDIDENDINNLVSGLLKVISYYHQSGIPGFNAALYLAREEDEGFWATLRMIGRFTTAPLAGSDVSYMQTLLGDPWSFHLPEETARELRRHFG